MGRRSKPFEAKLQFLDLFSGAGGSSLGLAAAGFHPLGAVESDEAAFESLHANLGPSVLPELQSAKSIEDISPHTLKRSLLNVGVEDLDLLVASPPCQGFSRIGRGKLNSLSQLQNAFLSDERNDLYRQAIKFLRVLRPRAFLFENVPGMIHHGTQNIAEIVCHAVEEAGYNVKCALLNAAWFGVPQIRERVIILAFRDDLGLDPEFPAITHFGDAVASHMSSADYPENFWQRSRYFVPFRNLERASEMAPLVTVAEAFADLPPYLGHLEAKRRGVQLLKINRALFDAVDYSSKEPPNDYCRLMRRWQNLTSRKVADHYCRWTPRDFATFALMKPGDTYPQAHRLAMGRWKRAKARYERLGGKRPTKAEYVPPYSLDGFEEKWQKFYPDRPSWTVTAHLSKDTYSHIHFDSKQARAITVREAARLQSFPDAFELRGNMGDAFRQIGNAVPPLMAKAIGRVLAEQLRRSKKAAVDLFKLAQVDEQALMPEVPAAVELEMEEVV